MKVLVKRVNDEAKLPTRAKEGDAGWDLYSVENVTIPACGRYAVDTGIQIEMQDFVTYETVAEFNKANLCAMCCSRSGLAIKHGVFVLNAPGIIDEGYRGNVKVILQNSGTEEFVIAIGDKVAQLVFVDVHSPDVELAESLSESERGEGGFGSTGRK